MFKPMAKYDSEAWTWGHKTMREAAEIRTKAFSRINNVRRKVGMLYIHLKTKIQQSHSVLRRLLYVGQTVSAS